ncbi:MAG: dihydropteroate synthase [Acidobacteria bacterium]|nr:dihydropteroate synthase [Acidobacteriota bacterium]
MRRQTFQIPLPSGLVLTLGERTLVMAIVNVTPDSFSDGGARVDPDIAIADALQMVQDGADVLDIGGESTRPGAAPLPADEEWRRVGPVLEGLRGRVDVPISIDTYKADIAARALALGATIVNDVTSCEADPGMAAVIARHQAGVVLMHHRGRSDAMYDRATYRDVVAEVRAELADRVERVVAAGVARSRVMIDPGFGFAKRAEQSMTALAGLPGLASLGLPILSGPSRKSFLQFALGPRTPEERVWGTAAAVAASIWLGAHVVRVHDVKAMVDVVRVTDALVAASV